MRVVFIFLLIGLSACSDEMEMLNTEFVDLITVFNFESEDQEWEGGISDFPSDMEGSLDFLYDNSKIPIVTALEGNGLSISADNPNGELFYFFKRRIPGLTPGQKYQVDFEFLVYTQLLTTSDNFGNEELYLKLGAVNYKPELEQLNWQNTKEFMKLNIDKGSSNSESGNDLVNVGSLKEFISDVPEVISGNTFEHLIEVEADGEGAIWLVIGVDSGVKSELKFGMAALTVYYRERN